ncbi:MAG: hypothetical protein AB7E95_02020 [Kiritimatiellales bacterium]
MKFIRILFTLAALSGAAQASSNVWNSLSTTVTLGYESRYVLYGYRLSSNLYHADIYASLPVTDRLTVWAGSWYGYLTDGTYHEVDFYTGADYQLTDHFSTGLAYSMFNYLKVPYLISREAHEISGHVTFSAGPLTLSLRDLYDSEGEGQLVRGIASVYQPLNDTVALSLSAEYGYSFDYFAVGDGPNHALFKAALPVQLNDTFSVAPFIAQSLALDVIDSFEEDQTYGGVSVSMAF